MPEDWSRRCRFRAFACWLPAPMRPWPVGSWPPPMTRPARPVGRSPGGALLQVELAVVNPGGERAPLVRREDQRGAIRVTAVAHGDHVVAALLRAGQERDLDPGAAVLAAAGGPAPDGAAQIHSSVAFLARPSP